MQCHGLKAEGALHQTLRDPTHPQPSFPLIPEAGEERNHLILLMFYDLLWVENDINKKKTK